MIIKIDKDKFESNLIHQGADKFAKGSAVFNINEIMLVLDKYTITDMPTKEPTKESKWPTEVFVKITEWYTSLLLLSGR